MTPSPDTTLVPPPAASPATTSGGGNAAQLTAAGLAYLRGQGRPKDDGMAVASLLDAADLDHPPAVLLCALCYFAGVGVTRNQQTASEYASKYLELAPDASDRPVARDIMDGVLGTARASALLDGEAVATGSVVSGMPKSRVPLIAGAAAAVVILAGVAAFVLLRGTPGTPPKPAEDIAALIPAPELEAARKDALSIALRLKSEASVAMKQAGDAKANEMAQQAAADEQAQAAAQQAAEQAQQEKDAQAEQLRAAQEQARVAEARAKAEAAELAAARERASQAPNAARPDQMVQLRSMYGAAVTALKQGEYDRANGLVDAMLAIAPNHAQVLQLKASIQQAKRDALSRMRAD